MAEENDATTEDGVSEPEIDTTSFDAREAIAESLEDPEPEVEVEEEPEPEPEVEEEPEPAPELVTIIVDGQEQEVPLSQIMDAGKRTLQKESAADVRLEKATKLLNDAEAKLSKDVEPVVQDDVKLSELRQNYIKLSQYGEEEEAEEAMRLWETELKRSITPVPQAVDPAEVAAIIKSTQLQDRINSSPDEGGYSDLMTDPILQPQFAATVKTLVDGGKGQYESFDTYKVAGDAIRLMGATLNPDYTPPVVKEVDSFEEKRQKKATITNINSATSKVKQKAKDDDKPEKVADTIAGMRDQREGGLKPLRGDTNVRTTLDD